MAYSRWSDSNWYSFWVGGIKPTPTRKEDEVLALWHDLGAMPQFSYATLKSLKDSDGINGFLKSTYETITDSEVVEANNIINRFLYDVEGSYKIDNNK